MGRRRLHFLTDNLAVTAAETVCDSYAAPRPDLGTLTQEEALHDRRAVSPCLLPLFFSCCSCAYRRSMPRPPARCERGPCGHEAPASGPCVRRHVRFLQQQQRADCSLETPPRRRRRARASVLANRTSRALDSVAALRGNSAALWSRGELPGAHHSVPPWSEWPWGGTAAPRWCASTRLRLPSRTARLTDAFKCAAEVITAVAGERGASCDAAVLVPLCVGALLLRPHAPSLVLGPRPTASLSLSRARPAGAPGRTVPASRRARPQAARSAAACGARLNRLRSRPPPPTDAHPHSVHPPARPRRPSLRARCPPPFCCSPQPWPWRPGRRPGRGGCTRPRSGSRPRPGSRPPRPRRRRRLSTRTRRTRARRTPRAGGC